MTLEGLQSGFLLAGIEQRAEGISMHEQARARKQALAAKACAEYGDV